MKNPEAKTTNMQLGPEEEKAKLHAKEESSSNKAAETTEQSAVDKEHVSEQTSKERQVSTKIPEVESRTISQEKEEVSENINNEIKEVDEQEDNDIKLTFEIEQSSARNGGEELDDKRLKDDAKGKELPAVQDELKNGTNEKEEIQSETPQTDSESYSVDIVESTTCEVSETSESVSQSDTQKDKEKIDDNLNNDASFVSYDSSIMLKDVQIRLNDCLKDNSKLFDENAEVTPNHLKDMSFGKTLRNISGRHSIGRMRHITLRDRRISPNSSLFVNTSTASIPHDEGTGSKVLHYNSDLLSDSFPTNGSPLDRKRKIETENLGSVKKQKTEGESSLLSTSIGLLRGFRNIQVSTPKVTTYKFESKLDISGIKDDDNKITAETTESTKKWCVIM
ncbi:myb-like protein X isoform X2 [Linepithema humile]|nr:PREDICTED: uncharacterized protein LOC105672438 isoform X2 [Linepithema humile]